MTNKARADLAAAGVTEVDGLVLGANGTPLGTAAKAGKDAPQAPAEAPDDGIVDAGGFTAEQIRTWHGRTCCCRLDGKPTKMMLRALRVLATADGWTPFLRLAKAVGQAAWPKVVRWALGNVDPGNRDPFCLMGRGWAEQRVVDVDGADDQLYLITGAGRAALEAHGG